MPWVHTKLLKIRLSEKFSINFSSDRKKEQKAGRLEQLSGQKLLLSSFRQITLSGIILQSDVELLRRDSKDKTK